MKYARLSKAQNRVVAEIAIVSPNSLYPKVAYGALPTLITTDSQTFTFGVDANGCNVYPMGKGGIYASLNDIPDNPLIEGVDFISEGNQIRIPFNGTFSGTLYWYGVTNPADITAVVQPVLFPEACRELIVIEAVRRFAQEFTRNLALADEMRDEWARAWPTWCTVFRTQFKKGGLLNQRFKEYPGGSLIIGDNTAL